MTINLKYIIIIILAGMTILAWLLMMLLVRRINQAEVSELDNFLRTRLGWKVTDQTTRKKLKQLRTIIGVTSIGSLVISMIAFVRGLAYVDSADSSISAALYWSAGALFFATLYCSALWLLISATLKKA